MNTTPFWSDNLSLLLYPEILPTSTMTSIEKWNASSRLILVISIALSVIRGSLDSLFVGILVLGVIAIVYRFLPKSKSSEKNTTLPIRMKENRPIQSIDYRKDSLHQVPLLHLNKKPTANNPFMNLNSLQISEPETYEDYDRHSEKESSKVVNPNDHQNEIDKHFYNDLFRDVSDVYGKMHSQRQFYTMPVTTIPNDQDKFAHWLYG